MTNEIFLACFVGGFFGAGLGTYVVGILLYNRYK